MDLPKKLRCVNPAGSLTKGEIYTAIFYLAPNSKCNGVQINNTKGLYILDRDSSKSKTDEPYFYDEDRFEDVKDKKEETSIVPFTPKKEYTKRCMACADKINEYRLNSGNFSRGYNNHYSGSSYYANVDKRFCSDKCENLWKEMGGVLNENS